MVSWYFVRKVIVIGGSTGGIQALCGILKGFPSNLEAPVLAVIHTTQHSRYLPKVLQNCSRLRVICPVTSEPIKAGRIYIPAPNRHLVVKPSFALSWMGPRENRYRPSVDALFRTAARVYRAHVIAVVLTGALDDGLAGSLAVKERGGTVIVQEPDEAVARGMPENVLQHGKADYVLPLKGIPPLLVKLASAGRPVKQTKTTAKEYKALSECPYGEIEPSAFTCPECGGVVRKIQNGKNTLFRCHVGHAFSAESFTEAHADALERALWVALRKLNEQQAIQETLAQNANDVDGLKQRHRENADAARHDMRLLHEILERL